MGPTGMLLSGVVATLTGYGFATLFHRQATRAARRARDRALTAEAAAHRAIRIWSADLRDAALLLQGHTEQEAMPSPGMLAALRHVLDLLDDLQDHVAPSGAAPALCLEPLPLEAAVQDAIDAVAISLGPARRQWRVAPDLARYVLQTDRRALSQILLRVFGNAARRSRAEDWIEIGIEERADGLALTVEDEGAGLCSPDPAAPRGPHSRGLGAGLALARRLMEAHGGALGVESAARAGTRVTLCFPAGRVVIRASEMV